MTWIYFLKTKSDVCSKFVEFYHLIDTQYQKKIQILRSDDGGEYVNANLQDFTKTHGILHQTSCPHTPEQNGVAERKNRVLLEMTRAMMLESHVPKTFWPEAIATSAYLLNRLPTKILGHHTLLSVLATHTEVPSILTLPPKIFVCTVFVHIPSTHRTKLDACADKCVFLGYAMSQKGYRCYNPRTRRVHITLDCTFLEHEYYYSAESWSQGETSGEAYDWLHNSSQLEVDPTRQVGGADCAFPDQDIVLPSGPPSDSSPTNTLQYQVPFDTSNSVSIPSDIVSIPSTSDIALTDFPSPVICETEQGHDNTSLDHGRVLPPRQNRGKPPVRYSPNKVSKGTNYPFKGAQGFLASVCDISIPRTVEEALNHPEWYAVMKEEMNALYKNDTWEKV